MKRILVIGMSDNKGGMESYIMNLYRKIVAYGYQFDFYLSHTMKKTAYEEEILALGGRLFRDGYGRRENPFLHYKNLKKVLKDPKIIGVYLNTCVLVDIDILKIAKKLKKKIRVVHSHNSDYMSPLGFVSKWIERRNKKKIKKVATHVFACSDVAGKWMFGNEPYRVIKNGIEVEKFIFDEKVREKIRFQHGIHNKLVVGTIGRIQYQKNPEFIVELFKEIHKREPNAVLLWAGTGSEEDVQKVEKQIEEYQLKKQIIRLGAVANANELYQAMDIFILPSRFEGLPFVLVEAQCAGLPCYVTKGGITDEADLTGLLCFLPLEKGASHWADKIVSDSKDFHRVQQVSCLESRGYSISTTTKEVVELFEGGCA